LFFYSFLELSYFESLKKTIWNDLFKRKSGAIQGERGEKGETFAFPEITKTNKNKNNE